MEKLTNRIYYMSGDEKTDRPFLYYVKGDEKCLAIDAGASANHVKAFYWQLEQMGLKIPDYTVITHWHWDHAFGMCAVEGETIASTLTNRKLREMQQWEWSEAALQDRIAAEEEIEYCAACMKIEYPYLSDIIIKPAMIEVGDSLELDLGNVCCQILQHDAPHSRDGLFVYIPEEKALIVGDADYEDYYDGDYKYDKAKLDDLIRFVEKFDFTFYLRGHEGVFNRQQAMGFLQTQLSNDQRSEIASYTDA